MGIKEKLPLLNSNRKIVRLLGYVVYAFLGLLILLLIIPTPDVNEDNGATITVKADNTVTKQEPKDFSEAEVTVDSVMKDLKNIGWPFDNNRATIKVSTLETGDKFVKIECGPPDITHDLVKHATWSSVDVMAILFSNPSVGMVSYQQNADFIDEYGNPSVGLAVAIKMDRTTADKIGNWENFKTMVIRDANKLFSVTNYYIHPSFRGTF